MLEEKQGTQSVPAENHEPKIEDVGMSVTKDNVTSASSASAVVESAETEATTDVPETDQQSVESQTQALSEAIRVAEDTPSETSQKAVAVETGEPSDAAEETSAETTESEDAPTATETFDESVEGAPSGTFQEAVAAETGEPSGAAESIEETAAEVDEAVEASDESDEGTETEDSTSIEDDVTESHEISSTGDETARQSLSVGYTGEILGEVVPLSSLDGEVEVTSQEQADTEALIKLIDSSLSKVSKDEIVTGRVISIGDKDVVIDIGFKSDGVIPKSEFSGEINTGDEVEVYLERIENYHGQLVLSKERAERVRRWEQVEEAFKNGTILEGTIIRRIKGGMLVNLIDGLEAFLPGSQIDMRPVRDFDAYLDRKMQFKIVKINAENENVVISHKALIERELASQRESILATMETGQVLEGVAKNITDFGVFVDLGGVDGLLHITDLTWGRVSHPTEIISLDEELKVVVLEYDRERQRISLGLKQLQPHPWENIEKRYKPGDIVEGKVVSITDYGAFLELEQGIEGLVHVSEMSWTGHIRHPSQRVSLGQMVKVSVLSVDHNTKKISLGMKQFEVNPWEGIATRYPPGTVLKGCVRNITHFGAFIEIEPGIDGLVHVSDLSWTKTIRHPSELIKKRQEISVVVLDVDEKRHRIALGHKQIETNPWTNLSTIYEVGSDHTAKVLRIDRQGLTVELPLEVEAFVPGGELKSKHESGFPPYQEGDELKLRVIRLDVSQKDIIMSETAKQRQEQAKERQKEENVKRAQRRDEEKAVRQHARREQVASGPTTVGELSGLEKLKEEMEQEERTSKRKKKASRKTKSDKKVKEATEEVSSDSKRPEVETAKESVSVEQTPEPEATKEAEPAEETPAVEVTEEGASKEKASE